MAKKATAKKKIGDFLKKPLRKLPAKKVNPYTLLSARKEISELKAKVRTLEQKVNENKNVLDKLITIAPDLFPALDGGFVPLDNLSSLDSVKKTLSEENLLYINGAESIDTPFTFLPDTILPLQYYYNAAKYITEVIQGLQENNSTEKVLESNEERNMVIYGDLHLKLMTNASFQYGRISHQKNKIEINLASLIKAQLTTDEIFALLLTLVGMKRAVTLEVNDDAVSAEVKNNLDTMYGDVYANDLIQLSSINDKHCMAKLLAKLFASHSSDLNFRRLNKIFK